MSVEVVDRPRGSRWSVVALVSTIVVWLVVLTGQVVSTVALLVVPAAPLAVVAGVLAVVRDRRTGWRVVAGLSGLSVLVLVVLSALVVFMLSAGGPTT